ncbi:hypothetical protein JQ607_22170 [Bradyrhizobium liaoningense]|uniref:hypothetical protein n=1 Tax=Bradyrhizobium liaoningense TaxID=43992 RepID=UPI001BA75002|nr:hypothetical protein [Bradyrhizobium liaoningense]MBR0842917.1 hypothetical protein [Bradyrhizobium liaoningense]
MSRIHRALFQTLALLTMSNAAFGEEPPKPLPPVSTANVFAVSAQEVAPVKLDELGGALLPIYKALQADPKQQIFYFLPPPYVDWDALASVVDGVCAKPSEDIQKLGLQITFHWPELFEEIQNRLADKYGPQISIAIPPNVGLTAYLLDQDSNPFEVLNTVPKAELLRNVQLSSLGSISQPTEYGQIRAKCDDLRSIVKRRRLETYVFSSGARAKVNRLAAAANLLVTGNFLSDLKSNEKQINRSTVNSSTAGGQLTVSVGPGGAGYGQQDSTTTTDVEHLRIVNRTWIDNALERALTSAKVDLTCDEDDCSNSKLVDQLFKLFFAQFEREQISIIENQKGRVARTSKGLEMPIDKIKIDESVTAALNQDGKYKEKTQVGYDGLQVGDENDKALKQDSKVVFVKKGEEWVPTTFTAYVVNTANLQRNIEIKFNQTVIGATSSIAMSLQPLMKRAPRIDLFGVQMPDPGFVKKRSDALVAARSDPSKAQKRLLRKMRMMSAKERDVDKNFLNDTDVPISVMIGAAPTASCAFSVFINDQLWLRQISGGGDTPTCGGTFDVLPGETYRVDARPREAVNSWTEFR